MNEFYKDINRELKLNGLVTFMHITIILASSITGLLTHIGKIANTYQERTETSFYVLTALQEIFLSYNMFFILDDEIRPDIINYENSL